MAWQPPSIGERPVLLQGAGVLGRRIAAVFISGGYNVHLYDLSAESLHAAADLIESDKADITAKLTGLTAAKCGTCTVFDDLPSAAKDAWLAVEAVAENIDLKVDVIGRLDEVCPRDCIIGSNSSSFRSSLMVDKVSDSRRKLVCNIHFTMPPDTRSVELMTDGSTYPEIFPFLEKVHRGCGMLPATAVKESTG